MTANRRMTTGARHAIKHAIKHDTGHAAGHGAKTRIRRVWTSFMALMLAAVLTLSLALTGCLSSEQPGASSPNASTSEKSVEQDLASMSWEDVLKEADGDTVTFCAWGSGGADAMVQKYWEQVAAEMKSKYNITVVYVEDNAENQQRFVSDYENGIDATIDMFWGGSSSIQPMVEANMLWGQGGNQWVKTLPSSAYLDWTSPDVLLNGTIDTNGYQSPFMKVTPAIVYASDKYDASLAWDASRQDGDKTVYGLYHNLSELYQWMQKYPGKFTYLDLLGAGGFHGKQFVTSVLYELTSDGQGGWKTVYNEADNPATRWQKIRDHALEWNAWATSSAATQEEFVAKSDYVWAYLNALEPYLFQGDNGPKYGANAYEMVGYVNSGELATSFTTCLSIYPKTQADPSYLPNAQLFLMQTSVGYPDFVVIAENSRHKAAAMVLCELLLQPEQNANVTKITGNAYNLDLEKLDSEDQKIFTDMLDSFPKGTAATNEELAASAHNISSGVISTWLGAVWDEKVVKS
jgi:putative spermidine/putrescine transport system substrate-binding protein